MAAGIPSYFVGIGTIQSPSPFSRRFHSRNLNSRRIGRPPSISCAHSCFEVRNVRYRPPGTQLNLLNDVSFSLPEKSLGLIFGQSGSGKTTLLQLLAGLNKPTSGTICIQRYGTDGSLSHAPELLSPERVGIVFQFPERYFVTDSILDEVTFGWPRKKSTLQVREQLLLNLQRAINWVGLNGISLDKDPQSLSGGYKRRLALAIQLVQVPDLLILDEPLAGLGMYSCDEHPS
ncbi:ABC transporter I family member 11, chloroplastic [Linum grandiflorum]